MRKSSAVSFSTLCLGISLFLCTGCSEPGKQEATPAKGGGATGTTVVATIADDQKPPLTYPGHGSDAAAPTAQASYQALFSESGRGVAYLIDQKGKVAVVHNGKAGREYSSIGTFVLSADGGRIAYPAQSDGKWRMVVDGKEGRAYDTLLTPVFSPDCRHVAYQAKEGARWYIVVDDKANAGTAASYTTPEFSADSARIAYVEAASSNKEMRLIVSDLAFGRESVKTGIGDQLFITNRNRTRIAAVQVADNKSRVIDFPFANPRAVHEGPRYDLIERVTVSDDGKSVCYCALKGKQRLVVLDGREEALPKGTLPELPVIRPDNKGAGLLLAFDKRMSLHQAFVAQREQGKKYDEAANLTYSRDSRHYAYAAREGERWFLVVDGHEGPRYDRVVTPSFSPDGARVVYRARQEGKRFVVVADASGKTVRQHDPYEQVFDARFTGDGRSVAYGVKDGNKLIYKVEPL